MDNLQPDNEEVIPDFITQFLKHASSSPNKKAILTSTESLTYRELYTAVLQWKTFLRQYPCTRVVICLERHPRLIAILLALQWLDITYIPVDIATPNDRLHMIIQDSQAELLLFDHMDRQTNFLCKSINVANVTLSIHEEMHNTPIPDPQSIAYIIYTSGSTGQPKGVMISRIALNNFLNSMSRHFLNESQDLALALTTIAFDISGLELYLPLWQQRSLFLANQTEYNDPLCLIQILEQYPITFMQTTPSFWKMMLSAGWQGHPKIVVLCGGEALPPNLTERLLPKIKALWNVYGPTEATIWCALKQIQPGKSITVGKAIDHMVMEVLDDEYQPLPPFVKGELYLSGLGLAVGYVDSSLNQGRFIPHPSALHQRLYRVGDIACRTTEDEFIIFGRTDHQVKLHGFRIELEEIEAQIQRFPGILDCAVTLFQEQLVAYVCVQDEQAFSQKNLLDTLGKFLPYYMIPKRIIFLDKLPKSIAGKVDRKSLPPPLISVTPSSEMSHCTSNELFLLRIWSEELKHEAIHIHDNFFELGGHSLIAARIIVKIAQQMGKQITLPALYQAPSVKELVPIIEQAPAYTKENSLTKSRQQKWLVLNDFQLLLWVSKIFEPKLRKFNVAGRKRFRGTFNPVALESALQLVLEKHPILSFKFHTFYPIQKFQKKKTITWIEENLQHRREEESEAHLSTSFYRLFFQKMWSKKEAFLHAKLFILKNQCFEIHLCMPHLISDENALEVLFRDLSNAYLYFCQKAILQLNDSFHIYQEYIWHENDEMRKHSKQDDQFWKQYLDNTDLFHIPEKYRNTMPDNQDVPLSTHIQLSETGLKNLHLFCTQHHVTLSEVISAAILLALQRACDHSQASLKKIFINTVKSTRDDPRYDHVIGCFLRIQPLKLELGQDTSLIRLAQQARQCALQTLPYQRAASLVKLASIGGLAYQKRSIKQILITFALACLKKLTLHLEPSFLQACSTLAFIERKNHYLININILNNFIDQASTAEKFFDCPEHPIPVQPYPIHLINQVFDVCFHRNNSERMPFMVMTSNLCPIFQEKIGRTFLEMIEMDLNYAPSTSSYSPQANVDPMCK